MNILLINTFHYNRGGDSIYNFNLASLLEKNNHRVIHFAMKHKINFKSEFEKYFVPEIDYFEMLKKRKFFSGLKSIKRSIWYNKSQTNLRMLLKEYKVDIAHLQNIRGHITTSILPVLKEYEIPVVWTLHDFFLLCPNSSFYSKNIICEKCRGGKYYNVLLNKCRKDSYLASLLVMFEEYFIHNSGVLNLVDKFICPSEFMHKKFIEQGFPENKMVRIPNFAEKFEFSDFKYPSNFLYVGRLSFEKGVKTLLLAFSLLKCKANLDIVGDGPLRNECEEICKNLNLSNVRFYGMLKREQVFERIKNCFAVIVPSECYENFPFSAIEAFAFGKPIIGSDLGSLPELIKQGERGLLFKHNNFEDLALKIDYLYRNPGLAKKMGEKAFEYVKNELNSEIHYQKIIDLYNSLMNK